MTARAIGVAIATTLAIGLLAPSRHAAAAKSSCEIDGVERIVAVGDVHGAYDRFVEILQTAGVLDARLRWAGGKTHFVQAGDIVDRGPDSRKALDLMHKLDDEARRAGGAVHHLIGNHEVMRMLGDLRYVSPGEFAAFATRRSELNRDRYLEGTKPNEREGLLKATPLGFVEMRVDFGREGEYGQWLRKLNVVVKINGIVFLHGGISPSVAGLSCDAINDRVQKELGSDLDKTRAAPLASLAAREDGPLWYRGLALQPESFALEVDEILAKQHAKAIVVAHTAQTDGRVLARFGGKVIVIDTGMQPAYVATGRASALEIQRGVFTAIYQDRRDILLGALTDAPKDDSPDLLRGGVGDELNPRGAHAWRHVVVRDGDAVAGRQKVGDDGFAALPFGGGFRADAFADYSRLGVDAERHVLAGVLSARRDRERGGRHRLDRRVGQQLVGR